MYTIYLTTECNFKCTYCYECYSKHLNITSEKMTDIIKFIFNHEKQNRVSIGFLGGEPLLKKDIIYQAVEYIQKNYQERQVAYFMTSNCSLMDDELINMMQKHEFHLRLSFDGMEETRNLNRRVKTGKSEYKKIMENILKIRDSGIIHTVRMTVAGNAVQFIYKNIKYLHEQGFDNINMVLDIGMEFTKELQDEFRTQMEMVAEYYVNEFIDGRRFSIDILNGKFLNMLGEFEKCFAMCGAGKTLYNIMPDGKIYPCSYLTNDEKFCIGDVCENVDSALANQMAVKLFDEHSRKCVGCELQGICHGMKCGYLNYLSTGTINTPSELTCKQEKIIYPILTKILHEIVSRDETDIKFMEGYIRFVEQDGVNLTLIGKEIKQRLEAIA